jgi:hypothetical protein
MCALESGQLAREGPARAPGLRTKKYSSPTFALVGMFLEWNEAIAQSEECSSDNRPIRTWNRLFIPVTAIHQPHRRRRSPNDYWAYPLNDTSGIIAIGLFGAVLYLALTRGEQSGRDSDRLQPIKPCRQSSGRMTGDGWLRSVRGATYSAGQTNVRAIHSSPRRPTPSPSFTHHTFSV